MVQMTAKAKAYGDRLRCATTGRLRRCCEGYSCRAILAHRYRVLSAETDVVSSICDLLDGALE